MQIDWLIAFLAVVDHGAFTSAATQLYRSQGRISSYIASLEQYLSTQLFDRDHRPVRLTPAGEAFVPHARAMLEELESGRNAMASVQGLVRGDVALVTYPSASASFVPGVLTRFSSEYPGVRVELLEQAVLGIDATLDRGPALVAIRPLLPAPRSAHGFESEPLWREPMRLVVPVGHAFSGRRSVQLAELAEQQLVLAGQHMHDTEAIRLLNGHGVEPRIRFLSDQPQGLVGLVRAGLALGFTNQLALETVRTDGVSVVNVEPCLYREVAVFYAPGLGGSPAAKALRATILSAPVPPSTIDMR
ncbi:MULTISPECIES: LysR family transcriptional regulator [Mycobacteriaceae]|uniref:LysR family transcriptional regulator n=1 Tax=Mycobacteriaceae TaxID=1762 RepID=UPI0004943FE4|nr:LysR family transcriptional regulator [Mycobacterium sp. 852013-50091_SCH5140682]